MKINIKQKKIFIISGIIAICLAFYGNTLKNGYALDDELVLTQNKVTTQGIKGLKDIFTHDTFVGTGFEKSVAGGRYRPLSLALLAIEHQLFGFNSMINHFVNIILYAFTCILLYLILVRIIPDKSKQWFISIPFVATFLFIIHPVHTEVVANIKGSDELLTLLGSLVALWYILLYFDTTDKRKQFSLLSLAGLCFFLALLSKENALTFLVIIPATVYIFIKPPIKKIGVTLLPLILSSILFLVIRQLVVINTLPSYIGELMNNPFLYATTSQKYATIFYCLAMYLKLLVFPHPLTIDYYPYHIALTNWLNPVVLFSVLFYLGLCVSIIYGIYKRTIIGFCIIFFLASLTIVSNIFVPVGTFMNERFIFIPSIGFTICCAYTMREYAPRIIKNTKMLSILSILFLSILFIASAYKTIRRNRVWKDSETIYMTDVKTSYNSAKSNLTVGTVYYEKCISATDSIAKLELLDASLFYIYRAFTINPQNQLANLYLGNIYFMKHRYDSTDFYVERLITLNSTDLFDFQMAQRHKDIDERIALYEMYNKHYNNNVDFNYQLGMLWGKEKGNLAKAIPYLERANQLNPNQKDMLKNLGAAYCFANRVQEAIPLLLAASKLDPTDKQIYNNLAGAYQSIGDMTAAQYYYQKSKE